jgi:DNA-binding HxlR family transcriptional regulator
MRSKGFDGMVCSIAGVMAAIGDRWGLLILRDIFLGLSRYEDFRQSSGVTNVTLSDRLKHLEANGLIERRRYQFNPERFEYGLTPKGRQVGPVMAMLAQIGDSWNASGASAPPLKFVNRKTDADVGWSFVDQRTGKKLGVPDVAIKAMSIGATATTAAHRPDGRSAGPKRDGAGNLDGRLCGFAGI